MSSTHLVDREQIDLALAKLEKHDLEAANLLRNYIRGLESRLDSAEFEFGRIRRTSEIWNVNAAPTTGGE